MINVNRRFGARFALPVLSLAFVLAGHPESAVAQAVEPPPPASRLSG